MPKQKSSAKSKKSHKYGPYCPSTMMRHENSHEEYSTLWFCRMCLKCLLSREAVEEHIINCNTQTQQESPTPP